MQAARDNDQTEHKHSKSLWFAYFMLMVRRVKQMQLPQVASSLTFTTVLSLVPMVTVALAVFTAFPMFQQLRGDLEGFLLQGFLPESLAETILGYVNQFSEKAKGLTAAGTVILGVTAITTMLTIDRAFNRIWHVKRSRSLINKVLLYWFVLSLAPILIGLSLSFTTAAVRMSTDGVGGRVDFLPVLSVLPIVFTVVAFTLFYALVPNRAVRWSDALVGGVVAALLFELSKRGFAAYITHFPSYTAVYGAMAAIPLFLLWIFLSWVIVLFGAAIVATLPVARTGVASTQDRPGALWVQGLLILAQLDQSRHSEHPGLTLEELRVRTRIAPDHLDNVLTDLICHGFVGLLSGGKRHEKFVLICDPATVSADQVAKVLFFDPTLLGCLKGHLPGGAHKMGEMSEQYLVNTKLVDWLKSSSVKA